MNSDHFFAKQTPQSRVKSKIVAKYFSAWANVMFRREKWLLQTGRKSGNIKLAYVDLFAGPGKYADGSKSTPFDVLFTAVNNDNSRESLATVFNDKSKADADSLREHIASIPDFERLRYRPVVLNRDVGAEISRTFEKISMVPTLLFVDPWGYKGLSLSLIHSVLKNPGSECIMFFNYNRINPGLNNTTVKKHMDELFGPSRADRLRRKLVGLNSDERELTIVEEIAGAFRDLGGKYVLPFRFKNDRGSRTSHHLIFISKHFKGYEIRKDIMASESSGANQGVPSFEYNPATKNYPLLFELTRPLDELEGQLLNDFAGRKLPMCKVYERHSVGRPFLVRHYKEALKNLEAKGVIKTEPPSPPRRKNTFAERVIVSFPARSQ